MTDARKVLCKLDTVTRSREPDRDRAGMSWTNCLPTFSIFSTLRQEEIARIRWEDLDERRQAVVRSNRRYWLEQRSWTIRGRKCYPSPDWLRYSRLA